MTAGGTTTSYTLSVNDRRQTATTGPTGGPATSTSIRHYADSSDNPAWIETTTTGLGGATSTARYAGSLGGDLGATIAGDGTATLPLANLHGDILTNITIPPTQAGSTPAAGIDGWSDYTEYGSPRDTAATTTVAGAAGYGWLGAKERSTTAQSAGLTLMGDRLYNAVTGRFTSLDPEPGGNPTAYTYPLDPINMFDLDGHWGGWGKFWRGAAKWTGVVAAGACIVVTAGACGIAVGAALVASAGWNAYQWKYGNEQGHRISAGVALRNFGVDAVLSTARPFRALRPARHAGTTVRVFGRTLYQGTHRLRGAARMNIFRGSWRSTARGVRSHPWQAARTLSQNGYAGYRAWTGG
ncbi:MAG: hypothetical protein HHJ13_00645 [Phycicoccus sp.]|nr:hypothetical protein [Phycicoccus sp.]